MRLTGAVAADVGLDAGGETAVDDAAVHRVEHDEGVVLHPKRRGRVDPVAGPAPRPQLVVHRVGVVAALAGHHYVLGRQGVEIVGVLQGQHGQAHVRAGLACLGGGEERGLIALEVALGPHPLHEHRAHHPPPPHEPDPRHDRTFREQVNPGNEEALRLQELSSVVSCLLRALSLPASQRPSLPAF